MNKNYALFLGLFLISPRLSAEGALPLPKVENAARGATALKLAPFSRLAATPRLQMQGAQIEPAWRSVKIETAFAVDWVRSQSDRFETPTEPAPFQADSPAGDPPTPAGERLQADANKPLAPQKLIVGEIQAQADPDRAQVLIHMELGLADWIELSFYDNSGRIVRKAELFGPPSPSGNDRWAYEYRLDASGFAPGNYYYTVNASKGTDRISEVRRFRLKS